MGEYVGVLFYINLVDYVVEILVDYGIVVKVDVYMWCIICEIIMCGFV